MTLIAFATYPDRAEIITDTSSYRLNGSNLGRSSKVVTVPHLDLAVATQGDTVFGADAKSAVLQAGNQVVSFDELADALPDVLRDLWRQRRDEHANAADSVVFLVGYSPRAGRFVSIGFATDLHNLEPFPIDRPWVMPCPFDLQPDDLQAARFLAEDAEWAAAWGQEPDGPGILKNWRRQRALTPPANVGEWVDLALEVRRQRAVEHNFAKTLVLGDVFHTRIGRGSNSTERVHSFDDDGEEFLKMIEGTLHPIAQMLPCWCGSGERFIQCHLASALDEPCDCKSGLGTFRECCAVDVTQLPATASS